MLEIACFNERSAIVAAHSGADRIELCADYAVGGVTPTSDQLVHILKEIDKPVNIMIRPRPGDFIYSDNEFEEMSRLIGIFKSEASGFVFGILDRHNCVDKERNQRLVELASPLPCTFHRAFDQVPDMFEAAKQIIDCGFKSILTSGGQPNAVSGVEHVAALHKQFGLQLSFILGGGVRSSNIRSLAAKTNVEWYHSAAITEVGEMVNQDEVIQLKTALRNDE